MNDFEYKIKYLPPNFILELYIDANHKIARRFQLKNQKAIFPPGLFHCIFVSIGIQYRGGTLNFWKDGFELQVTIPEEWLVKEYLLQVVFRCYEDDKYFNVFINTKNTTKGSSVVFDALQSIKGIINKFCLDTTANKEVHIELEEYGLHPEDIDYEPLSIARIKKEYALPDRSLHVNKFYFGVENCSTDGISSFQPYYIAEIIKEEYSLPDISLHVNNNEEVEKEEYVCAHCQFLSPY
jgi:hypothetical protein